jgi:hypothetical protein
VALRQRVCRRARLRGGIPSPTGSLFATEEEAEASSSPAPARAAAVDRRSRRALVGPFLGPFRNPLILRGDVQHRALGVGATDQIGVEASFLRALAPTQGFVSKLSCHMCITL